MRNYMNWGKRSNSNGKLLFGALAGVALGFTAGLLTAPRSGRETRQYLQNRTNETLDKVGKSVAEGKDKAVQSGKEEVDKIADKISG